MHWASRSDIDEAIKCGQMAVKHALQGTSGFMVTLVRKTGKPYKCDTGLAKLNEVAGAENKLPRHFINEPGTHITDAFREYCLPLIKGEVTLPMGKDNLPVYPRLQRKLIPRKCGEWKK
jgi:6-phosphofructokinase 1